MKIHKVLNNNMVRSINEQNQEVIVLGKGLGFKKQPGDEINQSIIEKIYTLNDDNYSVKLESILSSFDFENIQLTNEIVELAEQRMNKTLNSSIYISLTDHINYALQRIKVGHVLTNNLHQEIKTFYPTEFKIGLEALELIDKKTNTKFPEDEASFIAMHLLNAQLNQGILEETNIMTSIIRDITSIVSECLNLSFDDNSISYERFITHLKFFSVRIMNNHQPKEVEKFLFDMITQQYQTEYKCALRIKSYLKEKYNKEIYNSELMYLTIHINVLKNS